MVNFRFSSSPEQKKLRQDLRFIQIHVSNPRQVKLLDRRALALLQRNRLIPTRGPRVQRILEVVKDIRTQIDSVPPPDSADPNIDNHKEYCEILRQGIAALNTLTNRSTGRILDDKMKEEKAIQQDQDEIEMTIRNSIVLPDPQQIRVFKMDSPMEDPVIISEGFTTYREILVYLSNMDVVTTPELWIRHPRWHRLTKKGYKWEHVHGSEHVGSFDLDVVDVANRKDYIVALAHEKTNDEEVPFPLELNRLGDKSCCDPPCGNLGNHLKSLWKDRIVIKAKRFSESANDTVLATALDNTLFKERTNDLYLLWMPAPCHSARIPSQSF